MASSSPRPRILFVFGTRPEAIKLAAVIRHFRTCPEIETKICVTAQHRQMLDQVLHTFDIQPDYDLNVMTPGQTLSEITSRVLGQLDSVLRQEQPAMIFVQGDTTTTFCGALAGFYAGIPVAHVEAGLRTGDMRQPFPEEMNRVLVSKVATLHFASTTAAAANLHTEGVPAANIHVTGNSGIDALLYVRDRLTKGDIAARSWAFPAPQNRLVLVTAHRRESFGQGFENICSAILRVADMPGVEVAYPVHPNPNVAGPVKQYLSGHSKIHLIEPLNYVSFIDLMRHAAVLLTDSGGIQEEAPSLGKPVVVMREKTERMEGVETGTSVLAGVDPDAIVAAVAHLLGDQAEYVRRSNLPNPYGDGHASERIAAISTAALELNRQPHPLRST